MSRVRFRLPDQTTVEVGEGALIGRAATAQLRLDAPGVSEAHAFVSHRGGELRLLALRGKVLVNDVPVAEATLRPRLRVTLCAGVDLVVEEVEVSPDPADLRATAGDRVVPLEISLGSGTVRIRAEGAPALTVGGNQAELLRLLAEATQPLHWAEVARWFWPERDEARWRQRFDATIKELRGKFRDHAIRPDLVWAWDGHYQLRLLPGDVLTRDPAG